MARMEMSAIPASLAIPMEASADAYYELGLMHAAAAPARSIWLRRRPGSTSPSPRAAPVPPLTAPSWRWK